MANPLPSLSQIESLFLAKYVDASGVIPEHINSLADEINKAVTDVRRDILRKALKNHVRHCIDSGEATGDLVIDHVRELIPNAFKAKEVKQQVIQITISAKDDINPSDFYARVNDMVNAITWFKPIIMSLEQRQGNPELPPYGWHIHLLVKDCKYSKSQVIEKVYKGTKKFVAAKNYIDYQVYPITAIDNLVAYISGDKKDASKMEKVAYDKVLKEKMSIPQCVKFD